MTAESPDAPKPPPDEPRDFDESSRSTVGPHSSPAVDPMPRGTDSATGLPALARNDAGGTIQPRVSGHRRRTRGPGVAAGESGSKKSTKRTVPADVDLGLAADLPDRPIEEEEAERRAMEAGRWTSPSLSTSIFFSFLLFVLPLGLLLGARRLEHVQRVRSAPEAAVAAPGEAVGADAEQRLPLLQPLEPYRAPGS